MVGALGQCSMTLYKNNERGNQYNNKYPICAVVRSKEDLQAVVCFDHVCATYKDGHRKNANFIEADTLMMDCDNAETDNPASG